MLGLPKTTEFNKRIPKQKFYEQIEITSALKRVFIDKIRTIYWKNKLAATTLNIAAGERVNEIEVFEVRLTEPLLDEAVLKQIDKEIPYHILFLLEYDGKYQVWIGYKEASESGKNAFKVTRYYHTDWMEEENLPLQIEGLNIDSIYDNFVRQIAGDALQADKSESLKESVKKETLRLNLQKQISVLEAKICKEKQFNRQLEINTKIKELRKELANI